MTIGTTTRYVGSEHPYLAGVVVKITVVLKGGAVPGVEVEDDACYITDDDALAVAGGVTEHDRIEVAPWVPERGRFSFVTSDARAIDLECFRRLIVEGRDA